MRFITRRCIIRPFKNGDIDEFIVYRNDLDWMEHQSFKGLTREEYEKILFKDTDIANGVQLAIIKKSSNELIGDIYLKKDNEVCWIGYTTKPSASRKGYAFETVSTIIKNFKNTDIKSFRAGVLAGNIPSINLLKKLDFIFLESIDNEYIFELTL